MNTWTYIYIGTYIQQMHRKLGKFSTISLQAWLLFYLLKKTIVKELNEKYTFLMEILLKKTTYYWIVQDIALRINNNSIKLRWLQKIQKKEREREIKWYKWIYLGCRKSSRQMVTQKSLLGVCMDIAKRSLKAKGLKSGKPYFTVHKNWLRKICC